MQLVNIFTSLSFIYNNDDDRDEEEKKIFIDSKNTNSFYCIVEVIIMHIYLTFTGSAEGDAFSSQITETFMRNNFSYITYCFYSNDDD